MSNDTLVVLLGSVAPGTGRLLECLSKSMSASGGRLLAASTPDGIFGDEWDINSFFAVPSKIDKPPQSGGYLDPPLVAAGRLGPARDNPALRNKQIRRAVGRVEQLNIRRVVFVGGGGTQYVAYLFWHYCRALGIVVHFVSRGHDSDPPIFDKRIRGEEFEPPADWPKSNNDGAGLGSFTTIDYIARDTVTLPGDVVNHGGRLMMQIVPGREVGFCALRVSHYLHSQFGFKVFPFIPELFRGVNDIDPVLAGLIIGSHFVAITQTIQTTSLILLSEGCEPEGLRNNDYLAPKMLELIGGFIPNIPKGVLSARTQRLQYTLRTPPPLQEDVQGALNICEALVSVSDSSVFMLGEDMQVIGIPFGQIYRGDPQAKLHLRSVEPTLDLRLKALASEMLLNSSNFEAVLGEVSLLSELPMHKLLEQLRPSIKHADLIAGL